MKFICLGYMDETNWDSMSPEEQKTFIEKCLTYDAILIKNGHFIGGEALQSIRTATTIKYEKGRISVTDGPFAETKEQLGGFMVLKARDREQAIELMSNHPSTSMGGSWEIRPADEQINELYRNQTS